MASGSLGVRGGFQGSSWKNYMGTGPAGNMSLRELVDIQGSLHPDSRMMHPDEKEIAKRDKRLAWMEKELL